MENTVTICHPGEFRAGRQTRRTNHEILIQQRKRPSSFEPSCAPSSTKSAVNLGLSIALRENCAVYDGLTRGETRLATMRALALMSVEIGDDLPAYTTTAMITMTTIASRRCLGV